MRSNAVLILSGKSEVWKRRERRSECNRFIKLINEGQINEEKKQNIFLKGSFLVQIIITQAEIN